jgi:sulfoxide reductase heme-binding subunit YedZ
VTGPDPLDYGWWLASRSAGIVAFLGVSISVICGLLMANNLPRRRGAKKQLLAIHEIAALSGLAALAAHGLLLLGDGWVKPGLAGIAIPFEMSYRPAFTGLGILAGWTLAILGPAFYLRRHIGPKLWRQVHRWTIAGWMLAVVHVLGAGSDAGQWWLQAIIFVTAVPIAGLFALRMLKPAPAPRQNRPADGAGPTDAPPRSAQPASAASPRHQPVRRAGQPAAGHPSQALWAPTQRAGR